MPTIIVKKKKSGSFIFWEYAHLQSQYALQELSTMKDMSTGGTNLTDLFQKERGKNYLQTSFLSKT